MKFQYIQGLEFQLSNSSIFQVFQDAYEPCGLYIEYLMHFIVSRTHLGQLLSNLAKLVHSQYTGVLGHSRHHASNRNIVTCSMGKAEE